MIEITYHWQMAAVAVAAIACIFLIYKHKIIPGKLVIGLGCLAVVVLQLLMPPPVKETPLERSIRAHETSLREMADGKGDAPAILDELKDLRNAGADDEKILGVIDRLKESLKDNTIAVKAVDELREKELDRQKASSGSIANRVAELRAKASLTEEEQRELATKEAMLPKWYDKLPIKLGLDLLGGTEVRLRLRADDNKLNILRDLRKKETDPAKLKELDEEIQQEKGALKENFADAVDVIRERLNNSGLEEIIVSRQGNDKVLIQLPGMGSAEAEQIMKRVQRLGKLEFRLEITAQGKGADKPLVDQIMALGFTKDMRNFSRIEGRFLSDKEVEIDEKGVRYDRHGEPLYDWLHDESGQGHVIEQTVQISGEFIKSAAPEADRDNPGYFAISIRFNDTGKYIFERVTSKHVERNLAIILDGKYKSAPVLKAVISSGSAIITGRFSKEDAKDLSVVLKSGSLKVQIEKEFENTVGPTLGEDSIRQGIQAMLTGLALVVGFMLIYYLIAGAVTDVALVFNLLLILAALSASHAALTLPGIAGLILTIGMAVDANVLIFERIREEREKGNSLLRSLTLGYERAFVTIVDANVTTFVTALILHRFGTEAVKGFAMTLMIGILASMFASLVITRWIFEALIEYKIITDLKMARLMKKPSIDFIKLRRPALCVSLICIAIGLFFIVKRGEKNLGHDFTGGTLAHVALEKPISMQEARKAAEVLTKEGFGDVGVQSYGISSPEGFSEFVLRTKPKNQSGEEKKTSAAEFDEAFKTAIAKAFPLQEEGLDVGDPVEDAANPQMVLFPVELTMKNARSPRMVQDLLKQTELINPIVVAADQPMPGLSKSDKAAITVTIDKKDADGKERADEAAYKAAFADLIKDLTDLPFDPATAVTKAAKVESAPASETELVVRYELQLTAPATEGALQMALKPIVPEIELLDVPALPETSETPVKQVKIFCGASRIDSDGMPRQDYALPLFVRDQFQLLRQGAAKQLDFAEPFPRYASVGPAVASEMGQAALLALIYSLVAIFFYIWLRFQFRAAFGLGAIIALFHDVLFTFGALAIADELGWINGQLDLTIVAALLTLVGYSLNDTIVVFDRIRENLRGHERHMKDVINESINQTLMRTVITSLTTLLVIIALLVWGGGVIRGFACALLVGVIVGTYSSIFIASPLLVEFTAFYEQWKEKRKTKPNQ